MKDAYSFDLDAAGARHSYNKMFVAYLRTFARLGLTAIPMVADTGPIGGDLSHEFIILASTGESEVFCHTRLSAASRRRPRTSISTTSPPCRAWSTNGRRSTPRPRKSTTPPKFEAIPEASAHFRARHRGRPYFLFRHQIFGADEGGGQRPRRQGASGPHGLLRHRPEPARRGADRGQPRRGRHDLARGGRAVRCRRDQSEGRRRRPATAPASRRSPRSRRPASRRSTTIATTAPARNSRRWT